MFFLFHWTVYSKCVFRNKTSRVVYFFREAEYTSLIQPKADHVYLKSDVVQSHVSRATIMDIK